MGTIASPALNPLLMQPRQGVAIPGLSPEVQQAIGAAQGVIASPGPAPIPRNIPGIQPSEGNAGPLRSPGIASPRMPGPAALVPQGTPAQPLPHIASPATPPSPTSLALQQSKDAESAIKPPNYTGKLGVLEKIGDVAGRLFAPGIEQRLGVGTLGYQDRLATAQDQTDRLEKQAGTEATTAANAAKPEEAQAKIDEANQKLTATEQADAAKLAETQKNDTGKLTTAYRKQGLDAEGNPLPDSALTPTEIADRHLLQSRAALADAQTGSQQAHTALEQAQTDALANPNSPAFRLKLQAAKTAAQNADAKLQNLSYAQARTIFEALRLNPQILDALAPQLNLNPDQIAVIKQNAPKNDAGQPVGLSNPQAPTTATRSRGQFAEGALLQLPTIQADVNKLDAEGKLGPISGRWNDFLTGRIGANDPDYVGLRDELNIFASGFARSHQNTDEGMKAFMAMLPAQATAANMQAALAKMSDALKGYKELGGGKQNAGGEAQGQVERKGSDGKTYVLSADGKQWTVKQ